MRLMQDLVGETLAERYRLVTRLAGGGMGEVYRAHDLLLDRPVAVKVLQPTLASDPELVQRFKQEARAAARLSHPNVVAVYDWGSAGERTYFMVMEYVAGTDLRDVLVTRGSLEPSQAAEIVAALCEALSEAHSRGLVHRDVKPENVLIARDGKVKVADFGIAIVVDTDRTLPGGIPGTLRYLSPEQARGSEATAASDVWAAGALLAELVTGHPPLQGAGADFMRSRAHDPVAAPSELDPRVPEEIDEVVLRACALEPQDRFEDASAMAVSLRRASLRALPTAPPLHSLVDELTGEIRLPETTPTTRVARRQRSRRRLRTATWIVALLALLAVGAVAAASYVMPDEVPVPDLAGRSMQSALSVAEGAGLSLRVVEREPHFGTAPGEVIAQEPESGSILEGSTVRVAVSAGLPFVEVPDLTGLPIEEAGTDLRVRGIEVGSITKSYSNKRPGRVIAQNPSRGSVRWGGEVGLVVSKGPEPAAIPSLTRTKAAEARQRLRRAGFEIVVERAYSNDVRKGRVIHTTPSSGDIIPGGSRVEIVVSLGPEFAKVVVPDVRNMSVDDARSSLRSKGLRSQVARVNSCGGGTLVVETDPVPGTTVRENDLVALFVC